MRIYNSYSGAKEEFVPLEEGRVRMYVCGITAYDLCHVGHARAAIVFDLVYRYLTYRGYQVDYIRNFTDVDDKIIARAKEMGLSSQEVAEKYIQEFYQDMDALNLARPTFEPRATAHVGGMIEAIEKLVAKGYAYEVAGDVYYSVSKWPEYGRLSKKSPDSLAAGARIDIDERKNDPLDFALWKRSKPGEPSWMSPWGQGRPGWHIECSVMSQKYLGPSLDIHGGGQDLLFPHHENEIAQSEALTGKRFVNFWMHNGFVQINREKMSKSTGNYFTVREVLEKFHPEVLRLYFLSHHYRNPIEFSLELLEEAKKNLDYFYLLLTRLEERSPSGNALVSSRAEEEVAVKARAFIEGYERAMDDDFNSALALAHFYDLARYLNQFLDKTASLSPTSVSPSVREAHEQFLHLGNTLGLFSLRPQDWLTMPIKGVDSAWIQARLEERNQARAKKDWARADKIRKELQKLGIIVEDTPQVTKWRRGL